MSLTEFVNSSGWKNFMAKLYGWGAALVIVGALFKIQHWPGAGTMLTVGLLTEAIIFFFSAFEPLREEIDWTLVYPELAGISEEDPAEFAHALAGRERDAIVRGGGGFSGGFPAGFSGGQAGGGTGGQAAGAGGGYGGGGYSGGGYSGGGYGGGGYGGGGYGGGAGSAALAKFDEMLEKAEITPELFQKLGSGMQKLGDATSNINAMSNIADASNKYMNTMNNANDALSRLTQTYQEATQAVSATGSSYNTIAETIAEMQAGGKSYQQQLEVLNKNLAALNTVYELQKKGADDHMKESESLYQGLQDLMKNLTESSDDTKKYRDQVAKLNENLSALNNVYGNMLAAMNVK